MMCRKQSALQSMTLPQCSPLFCLVLCYQLERPFNLSKAHSEAFIFFLKVSSFSYSSHVPFFKAVKPFFINGSLHSMSWQHFTCSVWLAIPAATDLVFLADFLRQRALGTYLLCFFLGERIPTSHADIVLSPSFFHILPRYAFFSTTCLQCTFI